MRRVRPRPAAGGRHRRRRRLERSEVVAAPILVCADWSASERARAAWAADADDRAVFRLEPRRRWTLETLVAAVDELRGPKPAVIAFDAPLGLPTTFLAAAEAPSFPAWLMQGGVSFAPVEGAEDWSVQRPFVRPRTGGWRGVEAVARGSGIDLRRRIDAALGAESVFKCIGAKQVCGAACALWRELRSARGRGAALRVWPFEARLGDQGVVIAEIYPAATYAVSLPQRARSKAKLEDRGTAVASLAAADWVRDADVRLGDLDDAVATQDDFDAAVTAAALLRLVLENRPLATAARIDPVAEGGILGV